MEDRLLTFVICACVFLGVLAMAFMGMFVRYKGT